MPLLVLARINSVSTSYINFPEGETPPACRDAFHITMASEQAGLQRAELVLAFPPLLVLARNEAA